MSINVLPLLDSARTLICLLFLLIASLQDVRSREVTDTLWIIFAPVGLALTLTFITISEWSLWILLKWVIIIAIVSGFSLALFYMGLFGGADSKALICLAIAMPFQPSIPSAKLPFKQILYNIIPPPISSFNNAVIFAALSTILILIRNLVDYLRSGGIFDGLEHEGLFKKALALLTGYRVDADKLRSGKHFFFLIEEFMKRENGSIIRRLKVFSRLPMDETLFKESIPPEFHGKVWVTPGLPFIVFITLGFIVTVFVGDIILLLLNVALIH